MMLYKDTKVKVCSPDGDTDFLTLMQVCYKGDTLATYVFIIWLDYELRTSIIQWKKMVSL